MVFLCLLDLTAEPNISYECALLVFIIWEMYLICGVVPLTHHTMFHSLKQVMTLELVG